MPDSITSGYSVPCTKNSVSLAVLPVSLAELLVSLAVLLVSLAALPAALTDATPAPLILAAVSSKVRIKSSPMTLRFCSGSLTPRSRSKNLSPASTCTSSAPMLRPNVSTTCSASPLRSSPVSTNTQVRRSPRARWASAAATDESTPPDSPQIALPSSPTWAAMAATDSSAMDAGVQLPSVPHASRTNRSMMAWP